MTNRADLELAHLEGLDLSRAWMLQCIEQALDFKDRRVRAPLGATQQRAGAALPQ